MNEFDQGGDASEFAGNVFDDASAADLPEVTIGAEGDDRPVDAAYEEDVDTAVLGSEDEVAEIDVTDTDESTEDLMGVDADLLELPEAELAALRDKLAAAAAGLEAEIDGLREAGARMERQIGDAVADATVSLDDELYDLLHGNN